MGQNQLEFSILFPVLFQPGGGPVFSPLDISGLQLWLKADAGTFQDSGKTTPASSDGDVVGAWADQSGNSRDASQATTTNKPTLRLDVQNGHPVVRFDGVDNYMTVLDNDDFDGSPITLFCVINWTTDGIISKGRDAFGSWVMRSEVDDLLFGYQTNAGNFYADGDESEGGWTTSQWNVQMCRGTNALLEAWQNGVLISSDNSISGTLGSNARDLYIGAFTDLAAGFFLNGDIAEIILYNVALTNAEQLQVETYLNTRYAIF